MTSGSAANTEQPVVGRLAPSPTGRLHVGHARSFLLAWWHVRSRSGRILMRVEDLDRERVKPGATDALLADLEWLGLDWDGPTVLQSASQAALSHAVGSLLASKLAFSCFCTRKEIALSAPHAADGEQRYPGTCRDRSASDLDGQRTLGRAAGLRFRCDPGVVHFDDGFAGAIDCDPGREAGDFSIRRRDGAIAYQLAVVVDDARMGVTEVLRGADLLPSTGRQWLLQQALGLPHPRWFHVPLVVDDDGQRLAKRDGATTLASLRERGVDPRALVAWVANSAGLVTPSHVSASEVTAAFELARVPRGEVRFGQSELAGLLG